MSKKDMYASVDKRMQKELRRDNRRRMRESFRSRGLQLNMMIALFAVAFAALNYVCHFVPESEWKQPLIVLVEIVINLSLLNVLLLGMERARKKYDRMLIFILVCYALGDMFGFYSDFLMAVPYAAGHIMFIILLLKYTYVTKGQYILFGVLMTIGIAGTAVFLVYYIVSIDLLILLLVYQVVLALFFTLSINNPFYLPGAVVFVISDITGLLRVQFYNNWWMYLLTTLAYYLAILLIGLSAFNTTKKQVVTLHEFKLMIRTFRKYDVPFWVGGTWNAAMHTNFGFTQIRDTCFICDRKGMEPLQTALHKMGFLQPGAVCTESAVLYSDEFGTAKILLMDRENDGVFIQRIGGGRIEIDNDYFGEREIGELSVPYLSLGE